MRHYAGVKAILCLALLFAAHASADEAADRGAIDRTIAALNAPCKLGTRVASQTADLPPSDAVCFGQVVPLSPFRTRLGAKRRLISLYGPAPHCGNQQTERL